MPNNDQDSYDDNQQYYDDNQQFIGTMFAGL